jgi:multiple sugar transport system permease protein
MAVSIKLPESQRGQKSVSRQPGWSKSTLVTVFMLLFLIYFLLPFFWLIVSATKSNVDLFSTFGLWFAPHFNLFTNLSDLFSRDNGAFLGWLWNTMYYAVCCGLGATFVATIAGYAFTNFSFPGRNLLFAVVLGSIMVPATTLAIPTYLLLSKVGLINTPLAVILPSLVSPFGVYLMRVYTAQSVPNELLDAARIDGAGEFRIFWSVVLRILAPGFITVLLFTFVGTWNNYFLPLLVLSDPNLYPLTLGLASWNAQAAANGGAQVLYSLVVTGALVSILPLIIGFLFLQHYWQGGLTIGSVKS